MHAGRFVSHHEFLKYDMSHKQAMAAEEKSVVWGIAFGLYEASGMGVSKKAAKTLGIEQTVLKLFRKGDFDSVSREELIRMTARMLFQNMRLGEE